MDFHEGRKANGWTAGMQTPTQLAAVRRLCHCLEIVAPRCDGGGAGTPRVLLRHSEMPKAGGA